MKYDTSTVNENGRLVPWLAAKGELAYSPENPPKEQKCFQYGRVLPRIFDDRTDLRKKYYFGSPYQTDGYPLFEFWDYAHKGQVKCSMYFEGMLCADQMRAPIAIYRHPNEDTKLTLLIQHGSYQWVTEQEQPCLEDGFATLYRGIRDDPNYFHLQFDPKSLPKKERRVWQKYLKMQYKTLSNSDRSFQTMHSQTHRAQTNHLSKSLTMGDLAWKSGLNISRGFDQLLSRSFNQSFSLRPEVAKEKFGPNFVTCLTPLTNIRLTTFLAGESEAKIIDPNQVIFIGMHGCDIKAKELVTKNKSLAKN